MQNSDKTKGVNVVYNAAYIANNLAIKFCPAPAVQTVPPSGNVAIGSQQNVILRLSSCCLPDGPSSTMLRLTSNDPLTPILDVPVTIDAGGNLVPLAVSDLTITIENSNVHLNWSAAENADFYSVWSSTSWPPTMANSTQIGTTTTAEFVTPVSENLLEYYFVVSER